MEGEPRSEVKLPNPLLELLQSSVPRRRRGMQWLVFRVDWINLRNHLNPGLGIQRTARSHRNHASRDSRATGIEGRALKVGDRAPNFTLFNQEVENRIPVKYRVDDTVSGPGLKGDILSVVCRGHSW
jgi:hypothetical protein